MSPRFFSGSFMVFLPILALSAVESVPDIKSQLEDLKRSQDVLAAQMAALQLEMGDPKSVAKSRPYALDTTLVTTVVGGGSSVSDDQLGNLQAGGHDAKQRGVSVPNVELAFMGVVDPYVYTEVRIATFISPEGETEVELEEAFVRTTYLPFAGVLQAGQFLTKFGRINGVHAHAWQWLDQPVINSRVFGPDGMRGTGGNVAADFSHGWDSTALVTVQNARGETMSSFLGEVGESVAGRPLQDIEVHGMGDLVTTLGWHHRYQARENYAIRAGIDASMGPNASGDNLQTLIYGAHFAARWGGDVHDTTGKLIWSLEVTTRDYEVNAYTDDPDGVPGTGDEGDYAAGTLHDWGWLSELSYGVIPAWLIGLRYEMATGSGESVGGRNHDSMRDDRWRLSPLITWMPSEFTRVRLQYNLDHAAHLDDHLAHTVWLGVDVVLGRHPAHDF
jgi:hypothetical protein